MYSVQCTVYINLVQPMSHQNLKGQTRLGQSFPNWLKLHMRKQDPSTLITNYWTCTFNRNSLIDNQKLIRSTKAEACGDTHLPLPLPVRFGS